MLQAGIEPAPLSRNGLKPFAYTYFAIGANIARHVLLFYAVSHSNY